MSDNLPRRRVLIASAAALPVLLGTAGCRSQDLFSGPDPLTGPPRPAPDVIALQAVIAAEQGIIRLYQSALGGGRAATAQARSLEPLLTEHQQHLAQLRSRLIVPPGASATAAAQASPQASVAGGMASTDTASPGAAGSGTASPGAAGAAPRRVTTAQLRAAEARSAAGLVQRLLTVEPALAQLFASIAASDATHVMALGG